MLGNRFSADFLKKCVSTINEAHKQYSLLDTIFNYIFHLDLQENIYTKVPQTHYMSAGEASRHVVGFLDLL